MQNYDDLNEAYESAFSVMSLIPHGLRYLKVRTLVDREPLRKSRILRDTLGVHEDQRRFGWQIIREFRDTLLQDASVTSAYLDDLLREVYEELQQESGVDYQRLETSLATVSREGDEYWEAWNSVYRDNIRQHIQHRFVRATSIQDLDQLLRAIDHELNPVVRGYTIISWYNQWTTTLIERMILTHPNVVPTVRKIDEVDFFYGNVPFDLKVTFLPRGYTNALKKAALAASPSEAIAFLRENPLDLSIWLYENQGQSRFSDSHRFFLVLVDEENPELSWKLKAQFDLIRPHLTDYFDARSDIPKVRWRFEGDRIRGEFETFTDVLVIIPS